MVDNDADVEVVYSLGFYIPPIRDEQGNLDKAAMAESWADCAWQWLQDGVTPDPDSFEFLEEE